MLDSPVVSVSINARRPEDAAVSVEAGPPVLVAFADLSVRRLPTVELGAFLPVGLLSAGCGFAMRIAGRGTLLAAKGCVPPLRLHRPSPCCVPNPKPHPELRGWPCCTGQLFNGWSALCGSVDQISAAYPRVVPVLAACA